jgi:hypothetical protein
MYDCHFHGLLEQIIKVISNRKIPKAAYRVTLLNTNKKLAKKIMRPDEHITANEGKKRKRRMSLEIYYWEQVGNRFYFRYTPFAIILTIAAVLVMLAMVVISNFLDSREQPKIDTKITVPSPSPSASYPVIRQAPPSPPPARVNKPPQVTMPISSATPTQNKNTNNLIAPQHTPPAQPSTPPP